MNVETSRTTQTTSEPVHVSGVLPSRPLHIIPMLAPHLAPQVIWAGERRGLGFERARIASVGRGIKEAGNRIGAS